MIRLLRAVNEPGGRGPANGQYALQRALRAQKPDWLEIGGMLERGDVPWVWCWSDACMAAAAECCGLPYIVGPNVLFQRSRRPNATPEERAIAGGKHCQLMVTESAWYEALIRRHRTATCPVAVWPYPIDPMPAGPEPAWHDVLIYVKSGATSAAVRRVEAAFPSHVTIRYGAYRREDLHAAARRARCCVYWSDDDRGPLALAEILLCGCPAVGVPRGGPWIEPGRNGTLLDRWLHGDVAAAVGRLLDEPFDRETVRAAAIERFAPEVVARQAIAALEPIVVVAG